VFTEKPIYTIAGAVAKLNREDDSINKGHHPSLRSILPHQHSMQPLAPLTTAFHATHQARDGHSLEEPMNW